MTTKTPPPEPPTETPTGGRAPTLVRRRLVAGFVLDTGVLTGRALRHQVRHIDGVIMGVAVPVMLLMVFVYVFGGAIAGRDQYVRYVVPGIIVLSAGFGAAQVALGVTDDLATGTVDRLRAMATPMAALLSGHVLANVVRNLGSTLLVVVLAILIGFRPQSGALAWAAAAGVAVLHMLTIATVAMAIGILARSTDTASGFTFFVLFLPYVSSAFVDPETLPGALRGFAEHQPITPVIETMRALLLGTPVGANAWLAVAWSIGIIAVSLPLAAALFRRRMAA
jgi:ABC-2 type transport system permease protein